MKLHKNSLICLLAVAAALLCLLTLPQTACAAGESDLTFSLNGDGSGYLVSDCVEIASGVLEIPETHNGLPVTGIGGRAFKGCEFLTKIIIPDSVTYIGEWAFYACDGLTSITIPEGVVYIGQSAFHGCASLTSITLPSSVTTIDGYTFCSCSGLTSITIPEGISRIGLYMFSDCTNLTSVAIPSSVTSIYNNAFDSCTNLNTVIYCGTQEQWDAITIGTNNESLTNATLQFHNYENGSCTICGHYNGPLTFTLNTAGDGYIVSKCDTSASGILEIPETYNGLPVTDIGQSAFFECRSLTGIILPDSIVRIGEYAFRGCVYVTDITIPSSVTSIGDYAFYDCYSLTGITIPDRVTYIGTYTFGHCANLTTVSLPNGITGIDSQAFYNCGNLSYNIYENGKYLGNSSNPYLALVGVTATDLTSFQVHSNTKVIASRAFDGCGSLTSISIPDNIVSINYPAFPGCDSLSYNIYESCKYLGNDSNPYIVLMGTTSEYLTAYQIHPATKLIGEYAFNYCPYMTSITIPAGVKRIDARAFTQCTALTGIALPGSLTEIGDVAFRHCSNLSSVIFCGTQEQWDAMKKGVYNDPLINATLQFHNYVNGVCTNCGHSKVVEAGVLTFERNAAGDGYIITDCDSNAQGDLVIPDTYEGLPIVGIDLDAFQYCRGLTGITIPATVTSIGEWAFNACSGLTKLQVKAGNTTYHSDGNCIILTGSKALIAGCKTSQIPSDGSVTRIADWAFSGCSSLTGITIPNCITSIGKSAFSECSGLSSITIPKNVTTIDLAAFADCTGLTDLQVEEGNTVYHSAGNCIIRTENKVLVAGCKTSQIPSDGSVVSIASMAFRGCTGLTSIILPNGITSIDSHAFSGCSNLAVLAIPSSITYIDAGAFQNCNGLENVIYCGTQEQWDAISISQFFGNSALTNAPRQFHDYENGSCTICGHCKYAAGDIDGNESVTYDDAIYLLLHTLFGEDAYPLNGAAADIDGNGTVEQDDAVYLLLHTLFGDAFYPLNTPALPSKEELIG